MHKTLLRLWLVIWVMTLPLVHIHPDADHAHGMPGHVHGGTYHSILVNTPTNAEQGHEQQHHHPDFFSPGDGFGPSTFPSHPSSDFEEATYGFSVIKPSLILESEKSKFSNDVMVSDHVQQLSMIGVSTLTFTPKKRRFSILPIILSPRAPPILLI